MTDESRSVWVPKVDKNCYLKFLGKQSHVTLVLSEEKHSRKMQPMNKREES